MRDHLLYYKVEMGEGGVTAALASQGDSKFRRLCISWSKLRITA